ncbi:unnamed protein product [Rotaria sp. Silwood1]|nr:unnamed protein product [Rotaria sp. Silwood1]
MCYQANASSGTVVAGGNGAGTSNTQLNNPFGLYFDVSSNSLLIGNTDAHNVVRWTLGATHWTLVAGDISGSPGSSSTQLSRPAGLAVDWMGNLYVADGDNHRIQFFLAGESNGTTIAGVTATSGSSSILLNQPLAIALDSQLNLYVSDYSNHRIQRFLRY